MRAFYKTPVVSHMARATSPLVPSPRAVDGRSGVQRLYITAVRRAPRLRPRRKPSPRQLFQVFAVHHAPVPAGYAAPALVIEYMAPALALADRDGP